jgi:hypothetical protein
MACTPCSVRVLCVCCTRAHATACVPLLPYRRHCTCSCSCTHTCICTGAQASKAAGSTHAERTSSRRFPMHKHMPPCQQSAHAV